MDNKKKRFEYTSNQEEVEEMIPHSLLREQNRVPIHNSSVDEEEDKELYINSYLPVADTLWLKLYH